MPKGMVEEGRAADQHVKESEQDEGRSTDRAQEIAARSVNKQRSKEGRTKKSG
ncbi:MAG TPA: hypothetical protein PLF56_07865 [Micropruina sp.]|nr:hypothetical protein [Micropruina sp.]